MKPIVCAAILVLAACRDPAPKSVPAQRHYALLPGADAESPVKIETVERLCGNVRDARAHSVTAIALGGQRLRWKGRVDAFVGRRLVVGVGRLRVELRFFAFEDAEFEVGDVVEVSGVIESVDPRTGVILLREEAAAAVPGG